MAFSTRSGTGVLAKTQLNLLGQELCKSSSGWNLHEGTSINKLYSEAALLFFYQPILLPALALE